MSANPKVDCGVFKRQVYHFQADEVDSELRQQLQEHLNDCEMCARYLEVENSFLNVIKSGAEKATAPPGLETRLRSLLEQEVEEPAIEASAPSAPSGGFWSRFLSPQVALVAAAAVVALVALSLLRGPDGSLPAESVVRTATVVDLQCDQAGKSTEHQRACAHPRHFNALKLEDGGYWYVSPDSPEGQQVVFDRQLRGSRMQFEGEFFPDLSTIRLRGTPAPGQAAHRHGLRHLAAAPAVHSDL